MIFVLSLVAELSGGANGAAGAFNWLGTHWIPNTIFFVVFMIFAASLFGALEITLPSSMINKSDSKADKGGLIGAKLLGKLSGVWINRAFCACMLFAAYRLWIAG